MRFRLLFVVLVVWGCSSTAYAQSQCAGAPTGTVTLAPTGGIFTASADHNALLGSQPVLTSYTVEVCDGTTLVGTASIGKPTPNAQNDISFTAPFTSITIPRNRIVYYQVVAVGPGGIGRSAQSPPFAWPGAPAAPSNPRLP